MSYSLADIKTKALIYNTLEQKVENLTFSDGYIKIASFDKTEVPHYIATVDLLMTESDKVTKASIKLSNDYVEFFDCVSSYTIALYRTVTASRHNYYIKFIGRTTANSSTTITTNTQVRKGIMELGTLAILAGSISSSNEVLRIEPNYARALPDNYLTSVSGLTVKIENNNLIIS